jgi:hypothetical protein
MSAETIAGTRFGRVMIPERFSLLDVVCVRKEGKELSQ